jgi:hypothetical protein
MAELETQGLTLEPVMHRVSRMLTGLELSRPYAVDAYVEEGVLGSLIYSLEAAVYAEKVLERDQRVHLEHEFVFWVPRSTWHFFKHRHVDSWWMRPVRWLRPDVRYDREARTIDKWETVRLRQFAKYPECPLRMPEGYGGKAHVRYETSEVL